MGKGRRAVPFFHIHDRTLPAFYAVQEVAHHGHGMTPVTGFFLDGFHAQLVVLELTALVRYDFISTIRGEEGAFGAADHDIGGYGEGTHAARFIFLIDNERAAGHFIGDHGSVGDCPVIIHGKAAAQSGDSPGCLFIHEPAEHINEVQTPIGHLRRIFFPPAKFIGSNGFAVGDEGPGSEPEIPVKIFGRIRRLGTSYALGRHVGDSVAMTGRYFADKPVAQLFGKLLIHG